MNMFKPTKAKTVAEYIAMIEEPRRTDIKKLHAFIKKLIPKLKPLILYGMIGYGTYRYKSSSGREGDWSVVALASQKKYISVYACGMKNGKYVAEMHKKDFPKASVGRSCIRFEKFEDIDLKKLKEVILESVGSPMLAV
jgi:hypothetical protein